MAEEGHWRNFDSAELDNTAHNLDNFDLLALGEIECFSV
jgi:hypothetical protein